MNCPNCGAALEAVPNRSHLRCPYCQSLHFPEPVGEGIVPLDREHPFNCPRCERRLSAAVLDGDTVGYCTSCRGILLASDDFAEVVARRREVNSIRHRRVEPRSTRPSSDGRFTVPVAGGSWTCTPMVPAATRSSTPAPLAS